MDELVYPKERTLQTITLVLGILGWLILIVGTVGIALAGLLAGFIVYLFVHSALVSHLKGNGVELTEGQFPDLHAQFVACCDRLQIKARPQAYVLNGGGTLNAFATKFLGAQYVVLLSGVVEAMRTHEDGVRFYIGHELGHLRMRHIQKSLLRWPVLWLPLLGAAYSRARESTCDRHGRACSSSPESAARALAALAAGSERWKEVNLAEYRKQVAATSGFWMSFHELTAAYPWLSKRASRVLDPQGALPGRNGFSYVLAAFIPFAGRLGGGFGFLIMVYIVGVLAAVAIPAYQQYTIKTELAPVVDATAATRAALLAYYEEKHEVPGSLDAIGVPAHMGNVMLSLDPAHMVLTAETAHGVLVFTPRVGSDRRIFWVCGGGKDLAPALVPPSCRNLH